MGKPYIYKSEGGFWTAVFPELGDRCGWVEFRTALAAVDFYYKLRPVNISELNIYVNRWRNKKKGLHT